VAVGRKPSHSIAPAVRAVCAWPEEKDAYCAHRRSAPLRSSMLSAELCCAVLCCAVVRLRCSLPLGLALSPWALSSTLQFGPGRVNGAYSMSLVWPERVGSYLAARKD